jgi:hypothetical protein
VPSSQIAEIKGSARDVRDLGMQIVRLEGNNCGETSVSSQLGTSPLAFFSDPSRNRIRNRPGKLPDIGLELPFDDGPMSITAFVCLFAARFIPQG